MDREEDQRRYFIVVSVIFEVVTPLLRQRLERHYKKERCPSLLNFLDKQPVIHILFHLRYRDKLCCCDRVNCKQSPAQPLFYDQWKLLYSQKATPPCQRLCHTKFKANHVQLNELDLTLAGLLVMECTSLTLVEYEAMANLRKFKNEYLSHNTDGIILEDEFDTLWENLIDNVNHLAPNQEDFLRQIKNRTLDGRLCKKYMTDMLNIFCKLDKIDDKIDMNTEQIDIYGEKIERILAIVEKKGHTDKGKPQQFIQLCRLGQDVFCHDYQETYLGVLGSFDGLLTDNGRNVVSNGQKKQLLICDIDGSHLNTLQLQCKPWSITMITPSIVAVTLLIKHCVELYDINKQQKQKSIPVPGKCYGITTINNKLAVGGFHKIWIIDPQSGKVIDTIDTDRVHFRLHLSGDKLYSCSGFYNNDLVCYNQSGVKLFTTTLPFRVWSITSLRDGSLYVGCVNNTVYHVSSDGRNYKPVITDGLQANSICSYNTNLRKLVTGTLNGIYRVFHEN